MVRRGNETQGKFSCVLTSSASSETNPNFLLSNAIFPHWVLWTKDRTAPFFLEGTKWYPSLTDTRYRSWPLLKNFIPGVHLPDPLPYWSVFFFLIFLFFFVYFSVLLLFLPLTSIFSSLCFMIPWVALLCIITMYLVLLPKCQSFLILLIQTFEVYFFSFLFWGKTHYCPCSSCLQQIIQVAKSYSCIFIWFWSR